MYIPYEIWDEVYFFKKYEFNTLQKWTIIEVNVSKEWTLLTIEWVMIDAIAVTLRVDEVYPQKAIAKEELLRRVVTYANEKIIQNE